MLIRCCASRVEDPLWCAAILTFVSDHLSTSVLPSTISLFLTHSLISLIGKACKHLSALLIQSHYFQVILVLLFSLISLICKACTHPSAPLSTDLVFHRLDSLDTSFFGRYSLSLFHVLYTDQRLDSRSTICNSPSASTPLALSHHDQPYAIHLQRRHPWLFPSNFILIDLL